tara:strand:- start:4278 stop:4988 length:711 start_codon:yes stop_codon:yes gene_type:complete
MQKDSTKLNRKGNHMKLLIKIFIFASLIYHQPAQSIGDFELPKIPGLGGGDSAGGLDIDALTGKQSELVKLMTQAILNLTKAQIKFLEALGEKEAAIAAGMYLEALKTGENIGKDNLKKAVEQTKTVQTLINKKLAENKVLDAKAKLTFAKGIPSYGKGLLGLSMTGLKAKQTVDSIGSNPSPLILAKAGSLFFIAKETPKAIGTFASSTGTIVDFSTMNKIDTKPLEEAKNSLGR